MQKIKFLLSAAFICGMFAPGAMAQELFGLEPKTAEPYFLDISYRYGKDNGGDPYPAMKFNGAQVELGTYVQRTDMGAFRISAVASYSESDSIDYAFNVDAAWLYNNNRYRGIFVRFEETMKATLLDCMGSLAYELTIPNTGLRVHAGGVAGVTKVEFKIESDVYVTVPARRYKEYVGTTNEKESETVFTYGFSAGVAFDIDNLQLVAGYKYICFTGDFDNVKTSNFTVGVGIKF